MNYRFPLRWTSHCIFRVVYRCLYRKGGRVQKDLNWGRNDNFRNKTILRVEVEIRVDRGWTTNRSRRCAVEQTGMKWKWAVEWWDKLSVVDFTTPMTDENRKQRKIDDTVRRSKGSSGRKAMVVECREHSGGWKNYLAKNTSSNSAEYIQKGRHIVYNMWTYLSSTYCIKRSTSFAFSMH